MAAGQRESTENCTDHDHVADKDQHPALLNVKGAAWEPPTPRNLIRLGAANLERRQRAQVTVRAQGVAVPSGGLERPEPATASAERRLARPPRKWRGAAQLSA